MTRKQDSAKKQNWKDLVAEQKDFLKPLVQEVVQQLLELEMEETLHAGKGERTGERLGYRSGSYGRTLITRVGKTGIACTPGSPGTIPNRDLRAIST